MPNTSDRHTVKQNFSGHALLLVALAFAVCAMTIPRLLINYGMDGDGIRGMIAGKALAETGVYFPSRLPGNPLFEYFLAVVSLVDGHILANALVLVFYWLSIAAFWSLAEGRDHRLLLVSLLALTPIILVSAVSAKDYLPSLAMLLWCYVCARRNQCLAAYLLLGIAIGFRLPNAAFAIPLAAFLLLKGKKLPDIIVLTGLSGLMGSIIYAPIYRTFGMGMLAVPPHAYHGSSYVLFTGYKLLTVFGPVATVGLLVVLVLNARNILRVTKEHLTEPNPEYYLELISVTVFLGLFLRHSDKSEYLIPAIPFLYLLLWRWCTVRQLIVLNIVIVSFAFVSIELKGGRSGSREITFRPDWGIVVKDFQDRRELEALRSGLDQIDQSRKAVVVHGYGPVLGFENRKLVQADYREISPRLSEKGISEHGFVHRLKGGPVFFVSGLSQENVKLLQKDGYRVYYFSESAPSHSIHTYQYDPGSLGLTRLDIFNDNAFYRKSETRNRVPNSP